MFTAFGILLVLAFCYLLKKCFKQCESKELNLLFDSSNPQSVTSSEDISNRQGSTSIGYLSKLRKSSVSKEPNNQASMTTSNHFMKVLCHDNEEDFAEITL